MGQEQQLSIQQYSSSLHDAISDSCTDFDAHIYSNSDIHAYTHTVTNIFPSLHSFTFTYAYDYAYTDA